MKNKWMTREEFESTYYDRIECYIQLEDVRYPAIYDKGKYMPVRGHGEHYAIREIKAVMPIEKPEYSKEVGDAMEV